MKNRVINDVISHSGYKIHPRIILKKDDFDRIRNSDDIVYVSAIEHTIKTADAFLDTEPLEYNIPDGIRLLQVSRGVLTRTKNLGMAYRITGDKKYAERLYRELANAATFKDWNPYHHLDVGEMCNAFGIGYDWIYDYMTEEQRKVLRTAIIEKGFNATMDDYLDRERKRSYRWYQDQPGDNWKFVCNGGTTVAALAICDEDDVDREFLSDIFGYAFENTYEAVRMMYLDDGSYAEGFTYWNYASDYLGYYVSALKSAAGTDYGLADYDPVRRSAYYVKRMCANSFRSFNFGDAWESFMCAEVFFWIGKNFAEKEINTMRVDEIKKDPSIARVRDLFWYVPMERAGLDSFPAGFGSVGGANASFRRGFNENDLYAAIHFGDNDAYHGQADMGTFVVEWNQKRFVSDLGQDNYNVPRYRFAYRYRAEGHNTIVINPSEGPDQVQQSVCNIERFNDGQNGEAYASTDMSAAYFGQKVKRGMRMTEDRRWVIVRDEISAAESDSGYWFAHTCADVEIVDGGLGAILTIDGDSIYFRSLTDLKFEVMPAKHLCDAHVQDGEWDNSMYQRLAIRFNGSTDISVAITTLEDGKLPERLPEDKAIDLW